METKFGKVIKLSEQIGYGTPVKLMSKEDCKICHVNFKAGEEVETIHGLWRAIENNINNFNIHGEQKVYLVAVSQKNKLTRQYEFVYTKEATQVLSDRLKELEKKVKENNKVEVKEDIEVQEDKEDKEDKEVEVKKPSRARTKKIEDLEI